MLSDDPAALSRLRETSRDLLRRTYPEYDDERIEREVEAAEERVRLGGDPGAFFAEPPPPESLVDQAAPHQRAAWSTPARGLVVTVVLVAAVVLMALFVQWTSGVWARGSGILGLAVVAVACAGLAYLTHRHAQQVRLLSCRLRFDAPFSADRGRSVLLRDERAPIDDPSIVVARIKNTGWHRIETDDYVTPVSLHFPGRRIVSVDVAESEPENLAGLVARMPDFDATPGRDRITLPRMTLKENFSFKMFIVLEGAATGASKIEGRLRDGRITTRETQRRTGPYTPLWTGLASIFLTGALTAALLPPVDRPPGLVCRTEPLVLSGSTAFLSPATKLAGAYEALCPGARIGLAARGSRKGLELLNGVGRAERDTTLALSDVAAPPEFGELEPVALAVVPFTIVVNANRRDADLDEQQIRDIFEGRTTSWAGITGEDVPLHVVARSPGSGTRQTLEERFGVKPDVPPTAETCPVPQRDVAVEPARCERTTTADVVAAVAEDAYAIGYVDVAGARSNSGIKPVAIKGVTLRNVDRDTTALLRDKYDFWSVERVYRNSPAGGSVATAFLHYLQSDEAADKIRESALPCSDEGVAELCRR